jgi:tRNA nucleotidyltransferase (CCA-adding enzyme)
LLGLKVLERDWVVVGSNPKALIESGFRQVGKEFPVFIHPQSGEEYALARTERKTGHGYRGFTFNAHPKVSLEEDLLRRDLTINAIAEDAEGRIYDPWGGLRDLDLRLLRHVSPAFVEDPVRILRVARFAARFFGQGFRIAPETMGLMQEMVATGEVDHLVPERVFAELVKTLGGPSPEVFFEVLKDCGALEVLFPELSALFQIPMQTSDGELNAGSHTLSALAESAQLSSDPVVGFAVLTHDLGRALTDPSRWPQHPGYHRLGTRPLESLCDRLKVPTKYRQLAERVMRYHPVIHRLARVGAGALIDLLQRLNAFRQPEIMAPLVLACQADFTVSGFGAGDGYPQGTALMKAYTIASAVNAQSLVEAGLKGPEVGNALRRERIQRLQAVDGGGGIDSASPHSDRDSVSS